MNKNSKRFGAALLLATTSLVAAGTAQGTVIMETKDFSLFASGDDTSGVKSDMTTLTFDKFDPILGELSGVKFTLDSFISGFLSLGGGGESSGALDIDADIDFSASVDILLLGTDPELEFFGSRSGDCHDDGAAPLSCSSLENSFSDDFDGIFDVLGGDFGLFTGAGSTFGVKLLLANEFSCEFFGDAASCFATGQTRWSLGTDPFLGTLKVEYTFREPTGIPEPASLALFGAGLLGLGLARRRRRPT